MEEKAKLTEKQEEILKQTFLLQLKAMLNRSILICDRAKVYGMETSDKFLNWKKDMINVLNGNDND